MNQPISYGLAPHDSWIKGALTTTHQLALPQHDLRNVRWFVWEDQVDILFIETLTALETCTQLLAQCALDLRTVEQRLYGLQQSRRQAYTVEPAATVHLTKRELQVLGLVADGLSNQSISVELGISSGTVKNHVTNILTKLSARRRRDAVIRAQALGLI